MTLYFSRGQRAEVDISHIQVISLCNIYTTFNSENCGINDL